MQINIAVMHKKSTYFNALAYTYNKNDSMKNNKLKWNT